MFLWPARRVLPRRPLGLLLASALVWGSLSHAQSSATRLSTSSAPAPTSATPATQAPTLKGAQAFFKTYLEVHQARDHRRIAALYHDRARVVAVRHSATTGTRAIEFTGTEYKALLLSVASTEAPDLYGVPKFTLLPSHVVQVDVERQSVARGYRAPHQLFFQVDAAGRYWITGEKAIQYVK